MSADDHNGFFHRIELSAVITVVGVIALFSTAIGVVLIAPRFIDPSWVQPTSHFQVQMYEIADPNFYIARASNASDTLEYVHHLQAGHTLLAFQESDAVRIIAPPELEEYITRHGDTNTKLTSRLLLLRQPVASTQEGTFDAVTAAANRQKELQDEWDESQKKLVEPAKATSHRPNYQFLELYDPQVREAFSVAYGDGTDESYVGSNYTILEGGSQQPYHSDPGVIYVKNPQEFRITRFTSDGKKAHRFDPNGESLKDLEELKGAEFGFLSRKELIQIGEHIFAIEGCWYCHTDQTRTLIQDTVLNGSDSFAAPPSAANEYIYQTITFAGTRRIGPDLSRVGVKRPSRDWHKSHFWSPKTASLGSIMPAFRHFFDNDPSGTARGQTGIPNYRFEAIFQYLMTKGTRITPPTQAWWRGQDPIQTTQIIEGRRTSYGL